MAMMRFIVENDDNLYTVEEVAQWLRTSRTGVYNLMGKGLPFTKVEGKRLFHRGDVSRWRMQTNGQHADDESKTEEEQHSSL